MRASAPRHSSDHGSVYEAYLRLVDYERMAPRDRAHFLAIAAQAMRRILVERARGRRSAKRGSGAQQVSLDQAADVSDERAADVLALDEALTQLAAIDPRKSQIVELKYFGGLTIEETAELLGVSPPRWSVIGTRPGFGCTAKSREQNSGVRSQNSEDKFKTTFGFLAFSF